MYYKIIHKRIFLGLKVIQYGKTKKSFRIKNLIGEYELLFWTDILEGGSKKIKVDSEPQRRWYIIRK